MSDAYQYPGDDDPADSIVHMQRQAQFAGLTSLEDNPNDAARAVELGKATGTPAPLVYGDLENFEKQHKASLTAELLRSNQFLSDYATADPMNAKVSADDWGQLHLISQLAQPFGETRIGKLISLPQTTFGAAIQGFKQKFEEAPEVFAVDPNLNRMAWSIAKAGQYPFDFINRLWSGAIGAVHGGAKQAQMAAGVDENTAERRANEMAALAEAELGGISGRHPVGEPAQEAVQSAFTQMVSRKVEEAAQLAKPYIEAGVEPPPGLHPLLDQIHADQAKQDLKSLDELYGEAQKSSTRERSPEIFAGFIRQHTDARIGIDAEAVRKLYGDKVPEMDDNILGWVPGIQDQLALAEAHGGDVEVPLADWVAKADPEVAKELHDFIRVRPGGMTLEEAKEGAKPAELGEAAPEGLPIVTPVDAIRQATHLADWTTAETGLGEKGIIPQEVTLGKVDMEGGERDAQTFPAKEALAQIDKERLTGVPRALAEFFENRLEKMAGDTPVWVLDKESMGALNKQLNHPTDAPGFYHSGWHAIVLLQDMAGGQLGHNLSAHLLIHELAHAATVREMDQFPQLKTAVRLMMDETEEFLKGADAQARKVHDYAWTNEREFIAEAYSNPRFQNVLATTPISSELAQKLGLHRKGGTVWDAVRQIISNLIERLVGTKPPDTILDGILKLGPAFEEAGKRIKAGSEGKTAQAPPRQGELDVTRMEDRQAITGIMPKAQLEKYMKLIEQKRQEDFEFHQRQADKRASETQTKEWKENLAQVREGVREDLKNRPDIAADRLLREGELYGEKVRRTKIAKDSLTEVQAAALPPELVGATGIHADDLAGLFGYSSGDQLVGALARLAQERELEGLTPAAHFSKMVEAETERKMRQQYGTLEDQILNEAKDHVISQTQLDILHEEVIALGTKAGGELPVKQADLKAWVKDQFNATPLGSHSVDKYLAAAGRAGKAAEEGLLGDKPGDAFKAKQQQYISMLLANEAKKLEKQRDQFDRKVKTSWGKREVPGVPQKDAVWIHHILIQIGQFVKRSVQDLDRSKDLVSAPPTLRDYVNEANQKHGIYDQDPDAMTIGQRINMEPLLFSENWRTPVEQMTPVEFRGVFDSLKSIDNYGRSDQKYTVKGDKEDLGDVVSGLIERLKAAVDDKPAATVAHKQDVRRLVGSWILNPESWFNRLDLGNRRGPFNQLIVRPITEGQYSLRTSEREFAARWRDLGNWPGANKKIDNPLFRDKDGDLIPMTKKNAYAVLSNMGNKLQREKLIRGWGIADGDTAKGEQMIWQWLQNVGITQEDLARAQKLGQIFSDAFELSEKAYTHTAGIAPARIELYNMQTPWGETHEWYHPLIPDPLRHSSNLTTDDMIGESGYWRPSPASGYTKARTGAIYPIDLSFDTVPFKLKQILNDAAMRIPITEVSKILYHKDFQSAFKKYYGPEYASALDAWMKDAAGNRQWVPANLKALDMAATGIQRNMSTLQIGFNLGTVEKHAPTAAIFSAWEVGLVNWAKSMAHMVYELPGSRERWRFAFDESEELQNRLRHVEDTIIGQGGELFTTKTGARRKIENFKNAVEWYGHYPVGITDLLSAVSMWDAEYRKQMAVEGTTHGDAVYLANTAVRRTHGSSILTNRPGVMRYNSPFVRLLMPYYNFLNNALQRNWELGWKSKLAVQGRTLPEMKGFEEEQFKAGPQHIAPIMGGLMVYGVAVSLIEQMVDPLPTDPHESKVKHWSKILTRGYASMFPGVREVVNGLYGGHDPALGLYGTFARNVEQGINPKSYTNNPGQAFHTANQVFGTLSGLTMEPIGKAGKFIINTLEGKEHPKGMGDLFKGIRRGTLVEPRR